MTEQTLRQQLYASFRNRAMMYYHLFVELRKEVGKQKAIEILRRAIYNRGLEIGKQFKHYAPADLMGLKSAFIAFIPDHGKMFDPEVLRCDDEGGLVIKMRRCPLKEAWQEAGLREEEIATMCHIAGVVDEGTFHGAGFAFSGTTWRPGEDGCCLLRIRPKEGLASKRS